MSSSDDTGFLETPDDGPESVSVPGSDSEIVLATGVKWVKLSGTLVGSLVAGWFLGLWTFIRGIFQFFTNELGDWPSIELANLQDRGVLTPNTDTDPAGGVLDALTGFASDLIGSILTGPVEILRSGAEESASWVGSTFTGPLAVLAFPAGVAILMAGLWVAARGLQEVR